MTIEQFRAVLRAQPFQPFVLKTAGGDIYPVNHPETVLPSPAGRTVVVTNIDGSFSILDLLLVEAIKVNALLPSNGVAP